MDPGLNAGRAESGARGYRPPRRSAGLASWGGSDASCGVGCGSVVLATNTQLHIGQAFKLSEIDAMNRRGELLNAAAIGLDVGGGVGLSVGAAWTITDWSRHRRSERAPLRVAWYRP